MKLTIEEKEAHIKKCYKIMRRAILTDDELMKLGKEENE